MEVIESPKAAKAPVTTSRSIERRPLRMAYELGTHVPWYVVVAWTIFAVAYVTYQLIYLLPDLRAWFAIAR